jgi:hypothetical protein
VGAVRSIADAMSWHRVDNIGVLRPQVQQLKERASKGGQAALDADQRAKLASEDGLIQEIRSLGGDA